MQTQSTAHASACPFSGAGTSGKAGLVSRRSVLAGIVGLAASRLVTGVGAPAVAFAAKRRARKGAHGAALRGLDIAAKTGRDKEARFGLMFKKLAPYEPSDKLLKGLAERMNDGKKPLNDVRLSDVEYDTSMPAGYIYLGQFIDHDMTLDRTPLTQQQQDPNGMVNYDTPRFDLGSVYGRGPTGSPELYDPAKPGYLLVNAHDDLFDLPRDEVGAAHLGDPRNDENLIVAQLHVVFLRLHNKFRDEGLSFEKAQQKLRWHYQWLIVHDFLPRIVGQDLVDSLIKRTSTSLQFTGRLYRPKNPTRPYMPVEYSGAAYRYGHSMIRAEYEMQDGHTVPIFGRDGYEDLRGNRPIPHNLWIDWNYFFDIPGMNTPDDRNMARLIDTQLSLPLFKLPSTVVAPTTGAITALAERNLLRGKRLGLPAGQDVAVAMGIKPLTNAQLGLTEAGWKGKAPLWFYVLKEAELLGGQTLGPVGGRIVAEVILGLLAADKTSYFARNPTFDPGSSFAMGDLILMADAIDPRARVQAPEEPELPEPIEDPESPEEPEPLDSDEEINPEATEPLPGLV
ncbi:MAG TPA: heme peroxidase family protein [Propionibacteriaceae bacterium]|nr:heme peroxidase family protein [Propionibacteriaceae bacterium]